MDLRVSSSRKAILGWHQEFQPLLKRERERLDCKHFFTAVPMDSDTAMTAFVRPKSPKRNLPRYYPFGRVRLHTVHGRWPWARPGLTSVHIRRGVEPAELAEYLAEKKRFQSFNIPELFARMRQWPGISAESFVGAFDGSNRLIGGCVVWDPSCVRTLSLSQPSDAVYSFHQTMAFLSWLNIARPPFKPQSPLVTRYLLDLRADNDDILHSLVTHLYDEIDPLSTMTFLSTEGTWTGLAPQGFIYTEMDYGLYCLTLPDQAVPEFIKPNMARAPTDFGLAHLL
jgi:hypothetical protein